MFFVNAPKEDYEARLRERHLPLDEVKTPYICLDLDTGEHRVVVDTGAGNLAPTTGQLVKNLQTEGMEPGSIDTVVLTHAHPDHIGGNLDLNGNLTFPQCSLRNVAGRVGLLDAEARSFRFEVRRSPSTVDTAICCRHAASDSALA